MIFKNKYKAIICLTGLLGLGIGFLSAQTVAVGDQPTAGDALSSSARFSEDDEMPSSKNLPKELTPPGEPTGVTPGVTFTPLGTVPPSTPERVSMSAPI